jgi:hypothetical protein
MTDIPRLESFLKKIMEIRNYAMGGAVAGIIGSPEASDSVINTLKRTAVIFAQEYREPEPDEKRLEQLADEISGLLQTLRVTSTLSEKTVAELHDELDALTKG